MQKREISHILLVLFIAICSFFILQADVLSTHTVPKVNVTSNSSTLAYIAVNVTKAGSEDQFNFTITNQGSDPIWNITVTKPANFSSIRVGGRNNSLSWNTTSVSTSSITFGITDAANQLAANAKISLIINGTANALTVDDLNNANWSFITTDSNGAKNPFSVFTTVDGKSPRVSLNYPSNNHHFYNSRVNLNYTANDTFLQSCELWIGYTNATDSSVYNWAHNQTFSDTSVLRSEVTANFTLSLTQQNYTWNVRCNDTVNHQSFASANRTFLVTTYVFDILDCSGTAVYNCARNSNGTHTTAVYGIDTVILSNNTPAVGDAIKVFVNWSGIHFLTPNYFAFFLDNSNTLLSTCITPTQSDTANIFHYSMNCSVTIPTTVSSGMHTILVTGNDDFGYCKLEDEGLDAVGNSSTPSGGLVLNVSASMTLVVIEPDGVNDTADTSYNIQWNATESDNRALTVSCYVDTLNNSYTKVYTCFEDTTDDGAQSCDTTFFSPGNYFVWCEADNGVGLTARNYSSGPFGLANASMSISHNTTWRMFGQDYAHTRYSTSSSPDKVYLIWNRSIGSGGGIESSPTIASDAVFIGSDDTKVYSLNITDGSIIWNYTTKGKVASSPLVYNNTVFFGSYDASVYLLQQATGARLDNYSFEDSNISSSPVVYSNKFYIGVGSNLAALSTTFLTISKIWGGGTGTKAITSSPAVSESYVILGCNDTFVYAFNKTPSGSVSERIWNYTTNGNVSSSPSISVLYRMVFFGSDDMNVYALNLTNGTHVIWNRTMGGKVKSSPAIVLKRQYERLDNNTVIIGSDDWNLYALNLHNGSIIWNYSTFGPVRSSPSVAGGIVFFGSDDNNTYALNLTTGAKIWNYTTGGHVRSSPAIANGLVVIASDDGNVYAFKKNPVVALNAPSNGTFTSSLSAIKFNFTVTGINLGSCELWADWNSTWHSNSTTSASTSGTLYSFSVIIPDGTWKWNVLCNDSKDNRVYSLRNFTITKDTIAPLINYTIANRTGRDLNGSTLNVSSLTINLNMSFGEDVNTAWYKIASFAQQALCINCRKNITNITFPAFGSNTFYLWVNDSSGNINTSTYTFTINQDTDGNGTIDSLSGDDDSDGIVDINDTLTGNISNVNTNIASFKITINGTTNLRWPNSTSSIQEVIFYNSTTMIAKFNFNFNTSTLNLPLVIVNRQTGSDTEGYVLIKGLGLASQGYTKSVYADRLAPNNNYTSVCIRDAETTYITEVSSNCNATNETYIVCNGSASHVGSYTCNITNGVYNITGLSYSAVKEFCTTNWSCGSWDTCSGSSQSRTCSDINGCNTTAGRPALTQSCDSGTGSTTSSGGDGGNLGAVSCEEDWVCTTWGQCVDSKKKRACADKNSCGTTAEKPAVEEACETEQPTEPTGPTEKPPVTKPEEEEKGPTEEEKSRMIYFVIGISALVIILGGGAIFLAVKLKKKELPGKKDVKSLKEDMASNVKKGLAKEAVIQYASIAYAFSGLDAKERKEVMPHVNEANKLAISAKINMVDLIDGIALKGVPTNEIKPLLVEMGWKESEVAKALKEYEESEAKRKPSIASLLEGLTPSKVMEKIKKVKPAIADLLEKKK